MNWAGISYSSTRKGTCTIFHLCITIPWWCLWTLINASSCQCPFWTLQICRKSISLCLSLMSSHITYWSINSLGWWKPCLPTIYTLKSSNEMRASMRLKILRKMSSARRSQTNRSTVASTHNRGLSPSFMRRIVTSWRNSSGAKLTRIVTIH